MDPDVTSKGPRSGNCLIDPTGHAQWPLGGHAGGQGLPPYLHEKNPMPVVENVILRRQAKAGQ